MMKLYRLTIYDDDCGSMLSWHASKNAARAALRKAIKDRAKPKTILDVIEDFYIPTDKAGLLSWLNTHVTLDNG
jgi:hypothetical protein